MNSDAVIDLVRSVNPVPREELDSTGTERAALLLDRLRLGTVGRSLLGEDVAAPDYVWAHQDRGRIRGRGLLLAGLVAVAAIAAATAFGAVSRVLDLFTGTPAPPPVQQHFLQWDAQASAANYAQIQAGLSMRYPLVDANHVQGEIAIDSDAGPVYLWAAPTSDGGHCWLIQFGHEQTDGTAAGHGSCDANPQPVSGITWEDFWVADHANIEILDGRVAGEAATITVTLADGSSAQLQVVDHYFLAALAPNASVRELTAHDATGAAIGTATTP